MPSREQLKEYQSLPLELKIELTKQRIKEWVSYYGEDKVFISFSGGKDSTVLLDIIRSIYENIPAVFFDTGLEFPEIRQFVSKVDNVEWLKPEKTFKEIICEYGYPFISKEVSEYINWSKYYFLCCLLSLLYLHIQKQYLYHFLLCIVIYLALSKTTRGC